MSRVFLDTNVLAYQFDADEPAKQLQVRELLAANDHTFVVSTQVLLELFVVITRKFRQRVSHDEAVGAITGLCRLHVVTADAQLVLRAAATVGKHQLSMWDAMIVEAAAEANCDEIWTEDLTTGATLRGVLVSNPLAAT